MFTGFSLLLDTNQIQIFLKVKLTLMRMDISSQKENLQEPIFLGFSRLEMFRITIIDKRLQLLEVVVWQQWMQKNILVN